MPVLIRSGLTFSQPFRSTRLPSSRFVHTSLSVNSLCASGQVELTSRALISLTGQDASHFLQGLTTANIPPSPGSSPGSIYSVFLNAQGRILHDVFVYPLPTSSALLHAASSQVTRREAEPTYLIEVDSAEIQGLIKWLKKYKLRSKICLRALDPGEIRVLSAWSDSDSIMVSETFDQSQLITVDSRAPSFSTRVLVASAEKPKLDLPLVSEDIYRFRRYLWGIPEGQTELLHSTALVHDYCVDYMNGVDFRKGCYVGQELVIRTQHTGVVRKRVLPCVIYRDGELPPNPNLLKMDYEIGTEIHRGTDIEKVEAQTERRQRSCGKWIAGVGNVGLALCRLEEMVGIGPGGERSNTWNQSREFKLALDIKPSNINVRVKALLPKWWKKNDP